MVAALAVLVVVALDAADVATSTTTTTATADARKRKPRKRTRRPTTHRPTRKPTAPTPPTESPSKSPTITGPFAHFCQQFDIYTPKWCNNAKRNNKNVCVWIATGNDKGKCVPLYASLAPTPAGG